MTVHHLNCATLRPVGSLGGRITPPSLVAHCLLVERPGGLLLVDTGFGGGDIADPRRLGRLFLAALRPALDLGETARAQVERLGYAASDVTDIALTHLDLDHAGGLGDFPHARVHVFGDELDAAARPHLRERARYIGAQWAHGPQWVRHDVAGDDWCGLRSVTVLDDDVVLVPLRGHTRGHCGVAVRRTDGGWLLHVGDAYFSSGEKQTPPSAPPGLRVFQALMGVDDLARRHNQADPRAARRPRRRGHRLQRPRSRRVRRPRRPPLIPPRGAARTRTLRVDADEGCTWRYPPTRWRSSATPSPSWPTTWAGPSWARTTSSGSP